MTAIEHNRTHERGVTMVSVMLLTVSLLTMGLIAMRGAGRDVVQAGQLVARERALLVAQAAVDMATAQYLSEGSDGLSEALVGFNPQEGACSDPCGDCLPQASDIATAQRNEVLSTAASCAGRPCLRQGALAVLPDSGGTTQTWCDIPFRDLVPEGDAEARVTVWVRNNSGDALGANGSGDWAVDSDGRVVVTALATVRNTSVAIEQEVYLTFDDAPLVSAPMSPDEGYGGGHNNDNSSVSVCSDDYEAAEAQ